MLWHSWTVKITGPVINLRCWQRQLEKVRLIYWNWLLVSRLFNMWLRVNSQEASKCCKLKWSTAGRLITVVDYILKVTLPICLNMIYGYFTFICAIVCTVMDRSEVSQQEMELEGGSVWTHTLFCVREFTQAVHTCLFLSLRVSSLIQSAETEAYKQDERREWGIMKTCILSTKFCTNGKLPWSLR